MARVDLLDRAGLEPFDCCRQTRQPWQIVVAGLVFLGERIRLRVFVTLRPCAPQAQRPKMLLDPFANVQQPGAQRSEQPLMAWRSQQIDLEIMHVDRHMPERLGRID